NMRRARGGVDVLDMAFTFRQWIRKGILNTSRFQMCEQGTRIDSSYPQCRHVWHTLHKRSSDHATYLYVEFSCNPECFCQGSHTACRQGDGYIHSWLKRAHKTSQSEKEITAC